MGALSYLNWLRREILDDTPRRNASKLSRWVSHAVNNGHGRATLESNQVLDDLLASPVLPKLIRHATQDLVGPRVILGSHSAARPIAEALEQSTTEALWHEFDWHDAVMSASFPPGSHLILARLPTTAAHWERVAELRREFGSKLLVLTELLLPYTRLTFLQRRLDYYLKDPAALLPFYLGEEFFGPIDTLNSLFPLKGKSVIEFGPFDGCQTAGLVHFGATPIVCVEARAENATKTATAAEVFRWPQVRLALDDFHNAHAARYGRYDLAFAHGVYYHSVAPFVFLENLCSLSDTLFIGGFCATDQLPASPWQELSFQGKIYRAKTYREISDFTAGVNSTAHFFHADDLLRFFAERDYETRVVSDEMSDVTAGRFLRILARRPHARSEPR